MKTIGLIGGMSWESSVEYYKIINEAALAKLGGVHSAKSVMVSVDFAEIDAILKEGRWEDGANMMINAAKQLEAAGADFVLICTNTLHKVADQVEQAISIPLLHIADAAGEAVKAQNMQKVALLGTRFTMQDNFIKGRLADKFGLQVITPDAADQEIIHRVIFEELVIGKILPASKDAYLEIIKKLQAENAEAVILGCTELGLLVKQEDCSLPLFDTTVVHAQAAIEMAFS